MGRGRHTHLIDFEHVVSLYAFRERREKDRSRKRAALQSPTLEDRRERYLYHTQRLVLVFRGMFVQFSVGLNSRKGWMVTCASTQRRVKRSAIIGSSEIFKPTDWGYPFPGSGFTASNDPRLEMCKSAGVEWTVWPIMERYECGNGVYRSTQGLLML